MKIGRKTQTLIVAGIGLAILGTSIGVARADGVREKLTVRIENTSNEPLVLVQDHVSGLDARWVKTPPTTIAPHSSGKATVRADLLAGATLDYRLIDAGGSTDLHLCAKDLAPLPPTSEDTFINSSTHHLRIATPPPSNVTNEKIVFAI